MPNTTYAIHSDGTIDIISSDFRIEGIVPYVDDRAFLPVAVTVGVDSVRYETKGGCILLSIRMEDEEVALSAELEGFDGIHTVAPIGAARLVGFDHAYVQGFGMEGPSGYYVIDGTMRQSHGIIGLCGGDVSLVVYAKDHTRFLNRYAVGKHTGLFTEENAVSVGFNLERATRGTVKLPDLYIRTGRHIVDAMRGAAKRIADAMRARSRMPAGFHWCSWYYHYENLNQQSLEDFLGETRKEGTAFRYIQIDAGYVDHIGDWLTANHRYPDGLKGAAKAVCDAGYKAGIWIAPFLVGDKSGLYRRHPQWVVRDKDGRPHIVFKSYTEPKIWGNTDSDYYVLDITHPEAFSSIKNVFETLNAYGFSLYKTDFMLWGMLDSAEVVRYDNDVTSVEILRRLLAMIREAIGEDGFLLGSIAPFMPFIGFADGMRIAGDVGAQWSDAYGPKNLIQELPFDHYFNGVFWQNDPDSVLLRDFETSLTDAETKSLALFQALSGGIITTSDPVARLSPKRKRLLRFIEPSGIATPAFPYLTDGADEIIMTHQLSDWNLVFAFNPTEHPVKVCFRLDELFGDKGWFQYRYDGEEGGTAESVRENDFLDILAPHDSLLLFVTEEALREKPANLWHR